MRSISYSELRKTLASTRDRVVQDREPVIVPLTNFMVRASRWDSRLATGLLEVFRLAHQAMSNSKKGSLGFEMEERVVGATGIEPVTTPM